MGLEISTPVEEWESKDFAEELILLGEQYAPYADAVLDHGVDGSVLTTLLPREISETLHDLGIHNQRHRRVLQKKLLVLMHGPMDIGSAMDISRSPSMDMSRSASQSLSKDSSTSGDFRRRRSSQTSQVSQTSRDGIGEDDKALILAFMTAAAKQQEQEREALLARQVALQAQVASLALEQ